MRRKRGPDGKFLFASNGKPLMERDPARYGKGKRWRVRYLDPDGQERNRSFEKKIDAENFKKEVEADVLRGTYIDPDAGRITFRKQAEDVINNRTLDPGTRLEMRKRLSKHVYPVIGSKEIGRLSQRPSLIQELVKSMEKAGLAPSYIEVIMAHVGLVFSVAVDDELITKNPVKSSTVVLPKVVKKKLVPWTAEQVLGMADVLPRQYAATVAAGAGLGLRQGEIFGLSPDDIDWLRGVVHVNRQVKVLKNRLVFALPKGEKTREVPLPESVKLTLSEHMREFPPVDVTLPWRDLDGDPATARLFFSHASELYGGAVFRDRFNDLWHRALEEVGIVPKLAAGQKRGMTYREHGMHALRHYFVSVLLAEGESVTAVAEWAGHHSAKFTLDVYGHLMPTSEQRMRKTIDAALRRPDSAADGPQTAQEGSE
ncbi:site-specific integrase [Microbispora sp. GKU 823]|uniref:tyrosine-type recombinase/integrase n=1 Tax=Microbispora sp. GKU 823 TaxID=1652100 RepID=UPI001C4DFD60|nr:site-specific integrase [Microbispora sp. GKU 823]